MGFTDYLSDLYASLTIPTAEAEQANPGPVDTSGEQSLGRDVRAGGVGTAHHDRDATTRGGVSTKSPVAGTNEESSAEKEENEKTQQSMKARTSSSSDGEESDGDTSKSTGDASDDKEGGDEGEDGGEEEEDEEEEEEEEEDEEPEDIKPKLEEECMKTSQCAPLKHHYDECAERVQKQEEENGKAEEDCVEEFFHLMHCASQCAAPKLFRQLR